MISIMARTYDLITAAEKLGDIDGGGHIAYEETHQAVNFRNTGIALIEHNDHGQMFKFVRR